MTTFKDLFKNIFELNLLNEIEEVGTIKELKAQETLIEPGQAVRLFQSC